MSYKSKFTGKQVEDLLDKASNIPIYTSQLTNDSGFIDKNNLNKYLDVYAPKDFSKIPIDRDTLYWDNGVLKSKVGTSNVDSAFITLNGNEDVSGVKNFLNGIKLSGIELKYDSVNNAVYVQHSNGSPVNFYATGGLSMYGQGKTSVKTIMDAIAANLDSNTLAIENGLLTVIGGTGGGGVESITKQMVIEALGFTPYSAANPNGYITAASIPSAIKNPYALTFGSKTYDGSAAKSITASDLGAALSSDLSKYLPLSGGTISGKLIITHSDYDDILTIKRIHASGNSIIKYSNKTEFLGHIGVYGSAGTFPYHPMFADKDGNQYKLWHSGNFNPADYLPLSGGTLTSVNVPLTINRDGDNSSNIAYKVKGVTRGILGFTQNEGDLLVRPWYDKNTNYYRVWHEGNDGSGSGLNADLLDGKHISEISKYIFTNGTAYALSADSDLDTVNCGYYTSKDNIVYPHAPVTNFGLLTVNLNGAYKGQIVFPYGSNYEHIRFRSQVYENGVIWKGWRKLAYIDDNVASATKLQDYTNNSNEKTLIQGTRIDGTQKRRIYDNGWTLDITNEGISGQIASVNHNVASATKLQTARTIWGQSFDGTGNVSGDLNGVGRIIRTEPTAVDMDLAGNFIFKNPNSVASNYWHIDTSDGTPIFVVHNNGNVGVSITPEYKFHVEQKTDNTWASVYQTPKSKVYLAQSSGKGIYAGVLSGVSTSYLLSLKYNQTTLGSGGSSALYVRTDGNIGAGTENPAYKFTVNGTASASRLVITSTNSVKQLEFSRVGGNSITAPEGGYFRIITNGKALGDNTADLMVNNGLVTVNGNILATGGVTMQSQRSLKNVVDERGLSLAELSAIKPTRYTWKDHRDYRIHFGGIADDIQQVLPEVIYKTSDGTLTMDYGNAGFAIASSLIKPVVDHDTKIIDHDTEIRMLKIRVKELEEELKRYSA